MPIPPRSASSSNSTGSTASTMAAGSPSGPDGYFYLGLGDGGGVQRSSDVYVARPSDAGGCPTGTSRRSRKIPLESRRACTPPTATLRTLVRLYVNLLRIDVDQGRPGYAIPPTNPLGSPDRAESRSTPGASATRSASHATAAQVGDLFVSGVVESFWETRSTSCTREGNFGWAIREGTHLSFNFSRAILKFKFRLTFRLDPIVIGPVTRIMGAPSPKMGEQRYLHRIKTFL